MTAIGTRQPSEASHAIPATQPVTAKKHAKRTSRSITPKLQPHKDKRKRTRAGSEATAKRYMQAANEWCSNRSRVSDLDPAEDPEPSESVDEDGEVVDEPEQTH